MKNIGVKQIALCLALCLAVIVTTDLLLPSGEAAVYDNVIRLHILANSDTEADQAVKLAVRDAVLAADVFAEAESKAEAEQGVEEAATLAVNIANEYLKANGLPYTASYRWGYESYPTREYGGVRLPAGRYLSLRIVLGEGEGQNWWCVLFPPLCNGTATEQINGDRSDDVFSAGKKRYSFRFKLLEWLFA